MTDAKTLTAQLGGKWYRSYGVAPYPVCQRERHRDQDALTLSNGATGLLAHCKKLGCAFRDIMAAAGMTEDAFKAPSYVTSAQRWADLAEQKAEAQKRAALAQSLWREALPIKGTLAEAYLRGRAITGPLPETLRYAPSCWHATGRRFPAMVALVDGAEGFAVHRTYLREDGAGKADVKPPKAMLGAVAGGAVRLTDRPGPLVVAEGIETALSLASGLLDAPAAIWAALSTSGIRGLHLPPLPGHLTIAADGDDAGRSAAHALGERAHALGWQVSLLPAPEGKDWNDILTWKGAAA